MFNPPQPKNGRGVGRWQVKSNKKPHTISFFNPGLWVFIGEVGIRTIIMLLLASIYYLAYG